MGASLVPRHLGTEPRGNTALKALEFQALIEWNHAILESCR